jgi:hypothetical protein
MRRVYQKPQKNKNLRQVFRHDFLEESDPGKFLAINGLQGRNSRKTKKAQEKMSFFCAPPPVFPPNGVVLGSSLRGWLLH